MKPFTILPILAFTIFAGCEEKTATPAASNEIGTSEQTDRQPAADALAAEEAMKKKNMEEASKFTVPDAERKTPFDKD